MCGEVGGDAGEVLGDNGGEGLEGGPVVLYYLGGFGFQN